MTIELELFNTDRASASFTFHYRTLCWPLPIMLFFFVVAVILHPSIYLVLFPIEFVKQRDTHTHRHKKDRIPSLYGVFSHDKTFMLHPLRQKVTWTPGGWVLLASWFYHPPSIICFRSLVFTDRVFSSSFFRWCYTPFPPTIDSRTDKRGSRKEQKKRKQTNWKKLLSLLLL